MNIINTISIFHFLKQDYYEYCDTIFSFNVNAEIFNYRVVPVIPVYAHGCDSKTT